MIISHTKKFIFIHIYKVAGSSIRHSLGNYAYLKTKKNKVLSSFNYYPKIFCNDFNDHTTANEIKKSIPLNIFYSYYKFAFVRNPWDWQVSLFHFARSVKTHFQHKLISKMSFNEYLDWRINNDLHLQKEFVTDENGEIMVDFIGRYENLQNDFGKICSNINIPQMILPKINESKHKDYKSYYSSNTIDLVGKAFNEDIKLFNYTFEH